MNAEEAVLLAQEIHARLLVPMHFDLYAGNGTQPGLLRGLLIPVQPRTGFPHVCSR